MKFLKCLFALVLLSLSSVALGSIEIVNLSEGDTVKADKFTIAAKAAGFVEGDWLEISVTIVNKTTMMQETDMVNVICGDNPKPGGASVELMSVETINLSEGGRVNPDKFTILAKGAGFSIGDELEITVTVVNKTTMMQETDMVNVTAK